MKVSPSFRRSRSAAALQMPHGDIQYTGVGSVVNRQFHADRVNVDIAHNSRAVHVQQLLIGGQFRALGQALILRQRKGQSGQRGVVRIGGFEIRGVILLGHLGQRILIRADGAGLVQRIPVIAHRRIQQNTHAQQEHRHQQDG